MKSLVVFLFVVWIGTVRARLVADTVDYTIWRIPDEATDDATGIVTTPGVALIGGGDNCDPAFKYMINNANKGDFLVVRASSDDSYNEYVYELSQSMNDTVHSVTTVKFKTRQASFSSEVLSYFQNAEVIFFAGGDQSLYLEYWTSSPVQTIVQNKIDRGVTIGGTSAGLAILGTYIYS
jgi:cyanophycinase